MMGDWGKGILQTIVDYDIVCAIDEELGLRELRAKVNGKAGINTNCLPNRFSINRELCYHPKSVEIVRKYLDSGVLLEYVNKYFWEEDRCWDGEDYRRFHIIVACAMTLGCKLPQSIKDNLQTLLNPAYLKVVEKTQSGWMFSQLAKSQIKKALATYQEGEPYDFGNTSMLEATMTRLIPGKATVKDVGSYKVVEITQKSGKVIPHMVGPPDDEEIRVKPIYPNHRCASCGSKEKGDGGELLECGRCHDRKYCSKECQKKHWKMHKIICSRPADQMTAFFASIEPIHFGGGPAKEDVAKEDVKEDVKKDAEGLAKGGLSGIIGDMGGLSFGSKGGVFFM